MLPVRRGVVGIEMELKKVIKDYKSYASVMENLYAVTLRWLELYQRGLTTVDYFEREKVNTIAIYGMAELGISLYRDLLGSRIDVCYGIDRARSACEYDIRIIEPNEVNNEPDMIVVTPISSYGAIVESLRKQIGDEMKIVGLDEIILSLLVEE